MSIKKKMSYLIEIIYRVTLFHCDSVVAALIEDIAQSVDVLFDSGKKPENFLPDFRRVVRPFDETLLGLSFDLKSVDGLEGEVVKQWNRTLNLGWFL